MTLTANPLSPPDRGLRPEPPRVSAPLEDLPRELGRSVGRQPGPTLICLGGLHGNEPAGVLAIQRVLSSLQGRDGALNGELIGLVGNRQALTADRRYLDHDLNRAWRPERLARLLKASGAGEVEDREQLELDATLQRILDEAPGRVFLLDLHTTSGPGSAFAILDDSLPNREFALDFPVPLVLGLEEELSGTLASYLTSLGVTVLGFEAGQHYDPASVDRAVAAIWIALESCGLSDEALRREAAEARRFLSDEAESEVGIVEVLSRYHIEPGSRFEMLSGFGNFQTVTEGQLLARLDERAVTAPRTGMLLMPLYQDQGQEGFFLVREVRPIWLTVSATLRTWRLERILHLLPGVTRDADRPDTFIVDRRLARFFASRLFHLLGFRREGKDGPVLIMTRRQDLQP